MTERKQTNKRRILNDFFLTDSLADVIQRIPSFTITEEEGTVFKYRRTKIVFNSLNSSTPWTWVTPEVDTINCIDLSSEEKTLFSSLRERGYNSSLISYFADCELSSASLKDPDFNEVLLKRFTSKITRDDSSVTVYRYHLEGGNLVFHRILEKDPDFWKVVIRACQETELVKICELHLALDCNHDLMPYVSTAMKNGHYESHGLRIHSIYSLGGVFGKGTIGKRSQAFKSLKEKEFRIQTVYFGDSRFQPLTLAVYDKDLEQREKRGALSECKTRIELRFNLLFGGAIRDEHVYSIINSYYHPNGATFRTRLFLNFLTHIVRFTNRYNALDENDLAPWWKHQVLSPLYHASLEVATPEYSPYLLGQATLPLLAAPPKVERKRGRPKGSKDKTKRKPKSSPKGLKSPIIDV